VKTDYKLFDVGHDETLGILKLVHAGCVSDNHVMRVREDGKDCGYGTKTLDVGRSATKTLDPGPFKIFRPLMWA
jgi:hypothetical protein